jgi:uncharacterized protein
MTRRLFATFLLALVAACGAALGASAAGNRSITVNGSGTVTAVPNQAAFTFGVSVTARTAKTALATNARRMNLVIAAIEKGGIAARDIQTAQISLTPNTNENGTKVVDFTAGNSVTVTTRAIDKSGSIIDAAVGAGANTVNGPSLTLSDQLTLERRALAAAVADARARALAVAAAAHVKLGAVRTVIEQSSTPITFVPEAKAAAAAPSTPVEPGTVQTQEEVTVSFAIA